MRDKTAAIVVIGNEILTGKSQDRNASYLIGELYKLGVTLRKIVFIQDDVDEIAMAVRECVGKCDFVFTSGGVGPTHDDVTISGIARVFGRRIRPHPELEDLISNYFGGKLDPAHLRMAEVPEGADLVRDAGLKWPVLAVDNVYILPGVPEHFRAKFDAIRERFRATPFYARAVYTREDEFDIAGRLDKVAATHLAVDIGSYPNFSSSDYRVKITLESKEPEAVETAVAELLGLLDPGRVVRTE
jgi:molybdenum cofactor synthesis domain-containing protein